MVGESPRGDSVVRPAHGGRLASACVVSHYVPVRSAILPAALTRREAARAYPGANRGGYTGDALGRSPLARRPRVSSGWLLSPLDRLRRPRGARRNLDRGVFILLERNVAAAAP